MLHHGYMSLHASARARGLGAQWAKAISSWIMFRPMVVRVFIGKEVKCPRCVGCGLGAWHRGHVGGDSMRAGLEPRVAIGIMCARCRFKVKAKKCGALSCQ